jgi:hypothetical protein
VARSEEESLSVFEFIYIDRNRVSNLLSQLDENGILTSLPSTPKKANWLQSSNGFLMC